MFLLDKRSGLERQAINNQLRRFITLGPVFKLIYIHLEFAKLSSLGADIIKLFLPTPKTKFFPSLMFVGKTRANPSGMECLALLVNVK